MAKPVDKAQLDKAQLDKAQLDKAQLEPSVPEAGIGPEAVAVVSGTRMFDDGAQTMLLDQAAPDEVVLDQGALARAAEAPELVERLVSLTLGDLLPDDAGEVVLVAADDLPINLLSSESVTEAGIAPEHVTAGGMEVTGLHYYSFESGLTVYSPVDLMILSDPGGT